MQDEGRDFLPTHDGPLESASGSFGHVGSAQDARWTGGRLESLRY